MDPSVPKLLRDIEELGRVVTSEAHDPSHQATADLLRASRKLTIALRKPELLVEDHVYGPMSNVILKTALDLGIFKILVQSEEPVSLDALADSTKADKLLLGRIMRGLASFDAVEELEDEKYAATKISRVFNTKKGISGANFFHQVVFPGVRYTAEFLKEIGYKNPSHASPLPFNKVFGDQTFYIWLSQEPKMLEFFSQYMTSHRDGHPSWLDYFPAQTSLGEGFDPSIGDGVLLVDVGGGVGHEIRELKTRHPSLPGRTVLQDMPNTIALVTEFEGMQAMAHDFFTTQPIKNARAYYFRSILHNWDDEKCLAILGRTTEAMKRGYSKVLINDFVIPARGATFYSTHMDIMLMALMGSIERTERQWHELLASAGLRIDGIWTGGPECHGVIEASLI